MTTKSRNAWYSGYSKARRCCLVFLFLQNGMTNLLDKYTFIAILWGSVKGPYVEFYIYAVEPTSVNVTNNSTSPSRDYSHPDNQTTQTKRVFSIRAPVLWICLPLRLLRNYAPFKRYLKTVTYLFLAAISRNLLAFYHQRRSLIDYATDYRFCCR